MSTAAELLQQINSPGLTRSERALARCRLARELEASGNFEAARGALGELWARVGERPRIEGLDGASQAATLLRAGTLSGHLGSTHQIERAQDAAKDLISEALNLYRAAGYSSLAAEAQIELAWCYWREGAFDEARVMLIDALGWLRDDDDELRALALVRRAIVEKEATQFGAAYKILNEAAPLVTAMEGHHALKGTYHNTLAMVLRHMGETEKRSDCVDRALIEYAAASYHFEQAGHTRYRGVVENNLGYLYLKAERHDKAREHLDRSRRLFENLKDAGRMAVVDETRARLLLAEGRNFKAERLARVAVNTLSRGGEQARLIEALMTHAVALARLGQRDRARGALDRAIAIGEQIGDTEGAGRAALTLIEELGELLSRQELRDLYDRADSLLRRTSPQVETTERLRLCARLIIRENQEAASQSAYRADRCAFVHAAARTAEMLGQAERVARTDATLLIAGETGTGKEVLAAQVHAWSGRKGPLVAVNCAALNENLIESEVFGHRKGAFTDAIQDYAGAAKRASHGTLFLDEVGELSPANQSKLLRLLENKEIKAVGSETPERIDVRIIAATNRDLSVLVRDGRFRLDLYHRLCVFELEIPPLRERVEDIRPLAEHFVASSLKRYERRLKFSEDSYALLARLELPGNARELRSIIERAVILAFDGEIVRPETLQSVALRRVPLPPQAVAKGGGGEDERWAGCSLAEEVRVYEKGLIRRALEQSGGSVTEAARLLGTSHQALAKKINSAHQDLQSFRRQPRRRNLIGRQEPS